MTSASQHASMRVSEADLGHREEEEASVNTSDKILMDQVHVQMCSRSQNTIQSGGFQNSRNFFYV